MLVAGPCSGRETDRYVFEIELPRQMSGLCLKESLAWVLGSFSGGRLVKTCKRHSTIRTGCFIADIQFNSPAVDWTLKMSPKA